MKYIAIKNENCTMAGHEDYDAEIDQATGEWYEDAAPGTGDCSIYEVTQEEVNRLRDNAKTAGGGHGLFLERCVRTIEDYL